MFPNTTLTQNTRWLAYSDEVEIPTEYNWADALHRHLVEGLRDAKFGLTANTETVTLKECTIALNVKIRIY